MDNNTSQTDLENRPTENEGSSQLSISEKLEAESFTTHSTDEFLIHIKKIMTCIIENSAPITESTFDVDPDVQKRREKERDSKFEELFNFIKDMLELVEKSERYLENQRLNSEADVEYIMKEKSRTAIYLSNIRKFNPGAFKRSLQKEQNAKLDELNYEIEKLNLKLKSTEKQRHTTEELFLEIKSIINQSKAVEIGIHNELLLHDETSQQLYELAQLDFLFKHMEEEKLYIIEKLGSIQERYTHVLKIPREISLESEYETQVAEEFARKCSDAGSDYKDQYGKDDESKKAEQLPNSDEFKTKEENLSNIDIANRKLIIAQLKEQIEQVDLMLEARMKMIPVFKDAEQEHIDRLEYLIKKILKKDVIIDKIKKKLADRFAKYNKLLSTVNKTQEDLIELENLADLYVISKIKTQEDNFHK